MLKIGGLKIKKIALIAFGILLVLLFEVLLCLIGRIFLFSRSAEEMFSQHKNFTKVIYCIGDSHTFGVGASYKYGYPKQLEMLLNLNNPEIGYKVINLGIPGLSTKHQSERLERYLNKNKADVVIVLTGENNYYEVKLWRNKSLLKSAIINIKKMKIYKITQYLFYRLFKTGLKENINAAIEKKEYEDYIDFYLNKMKLSCEKHDAQLLFISYYSLSLGAVEEFAMRSRELYFSLSRDFSAIISEDKLSNFISRDGSHLNLYGYNIFAQLLYKKMFLHQTALGLKLNPLTEEIDKNFFPKKPKASYLKYIFDRSVFYEN